MASWDTKVPKDPHSSADAVRASLINKPGSGEPDDMPAEPLRPLAQIHQDLGKHLQTGEDDMSPLPKGTK